MDNLKDGLLLSAAWLCIILGAVGLTFGDAPGHRMEQEAFLLCGVVLLALCRLTSVLRDKL